MAPNGMLDLNKLDYHLNETQIKNTLKWMIENSDYNKCKLEGLNISKEQLDQLKMKVGVHEQVPVAGVRGTPVQKISGTVVTAKLVPRAAVVGGKTKSRRSTRRSSRKTSRKTNRRSRKTNRRSRKTNRRSTRKTNKRSRKTNKRSRKT